MDIEFLHGLEPDSRNIIVKKDHFRIRIADAHMEIPFRHLEAQAVIEIEPQAIDPCFPTHRPDQRLSRRKEPCLVAETSFHFLLGQFLAAKVTNRVLQLHYIISTCTCFPQNDMP